MFNNFFMSDLFTAIFVTILTVILHLVTRVIIGEAVAFYARTHRFDRSSFLFKERAFEKRLYGFLRVGRWKNRMITAKPVMFDLKRHTPEDVLQHTMQAETVHWISSICSFFPVFLSIPYHHVALFMITSAIGSCIDLAYVAIQRYNRPRIVRYIEVLKGRRGSETI